MHTQTPSRLAILGVGSIEPAAMAVATVATYFGERPLDVVVFDPCIERRELIARLARTCCDAMRSTHALFEAASGAEALAGASHAILIAAPQVGYGRCDFDQKFEGSVLTLQSKRAPVNRAFFSTRWPTASDMLGWKPQVVPHDAWTAHQVLRWVRADEWVQPLLDAASESPVRAWLNGDLDPRLNLVHEA